MIAETTARTGDETLLGRLRGGSFVTRVHSAFDHAVNVIDAGGLFTLATSGTDDGPLKLVLAVPSLRNLAISPGTRVQVVDSKVSLGLLKVNLNATTSWQPVLPQWRPEPGQLAWFEQLLDGEGVRLAGRTGWTAQAGSALAEAAHAFESALSAGDLDGAYRSGGRMVGLGVGLTPAGDDFLLGLAAVLALPGGDVRRYRQVVRRIVEDNADRTNDISRVALMQAISGRVRESIIELMAALVGEGGTALPARARRVFAIGHSSGTDIAVGMAAGLRLRQRLDARAATPRG